MVGAGDSITRPMIFDNCLISNYKTGAPMTTPPLCAVVGTAPNNGVILMKNCTLFGYVAYAAASYGRVFVSSPVGSTTGGLALVTPS